MSWCTVESDPGVFTELIESFGVKGVQVEELIALEPEFFERLNPIYGLVFLFKWVERKPDAPKRQFDMTSPVFFANQVVNNACGTQALLHILLNHKDIDAGPILTDFKSFATAAALPPNLIGECLGNQEAIRKAHNSFARPEPFVAEKRAATEDDAAYHFVAYVPVGDKVFELDGLQKGPVNVGTIKAGTPWTTVAKEAIQSRIAGYGGEIMFSLMALCRNRKEQCLEELAILESRLAALAAGSASDERAAVEAKIAQLRATIVAEEAKFKKFKAENVRRRHNYIPLIVELLKVLAEGKQLDKLMEAGEEKAKAAYEKAVKRKADEKKRKADAAAAASSATASASASSGGGGAGGGAGKK